MPVIVANGGGLEPASLTIGQQDIPVAVVGTADTFPGTSSDRRPLVVMDGSALARAFHGLPDPLATPRAATEIWVRGPADRVVHTLDALEVRPQLLLTAEAVQDIPFIEAAVQTFLVLQVLGLSAVALLVVVAVVYLSAKQRGRAVATSLSDRMGMRRATMRTASIVELGVLLGVSLFVGAMAGVVSVKLIVPSLDPLPSIPPGPLIVLPVTSLAITAACFALAALVGGTVTDRGARRDSTAEVMRVAE